MTRLFISIGAIFSFGLLVSASGFGAVAQKEGDRASDQNRDKVPQETSPNKRPSKIEGKVTIKLPQFEMTKSSEGVEKLKKLEEQIAAKFSIQDELKWRVSEALRQAQILVDFSNRRWAVNDPNQASAIATSHLFIQNSISLIVGEPRLKGKGIEALLVFVTSLKREELETQLKMEKVESPGSSVEQVLACDSNNLRNAIQLSILTSLISRDNYDAARSTIDSLREISKNSDIPEFTTFVERFSEELNKIPRPEVAPAPQKDFRSVPGRTAPDETRADGVQFNRSVDEQFKTDAHI